MALLLLAFMLAGSRWAGLADKDSSEDEEADAAAAARAAAQRTEAIKRQLKEQLTAILLEVTDRMFGAWKLLNSGCIIVLLVARQTYAVPGNMIQWCYEPL